MLVQYWAPLLHHMSGPCAWEPHCHGIFHLPPMLLNTPEKVKIQYFITFTGQNLTASSFQKRLVFLIKNRPGLMYGGP